VKLDDNLPLNPKVRRVSVAARWSYVASICYAGNSRTDGYVPCGALSLVDGTQRIASELVSAGLWETAPDGWRIHDYLKHNRSKEKVEQVSTARSEAGRASAAKRHQPVEQVPNKLLNKMAAAGEQVAGNLFLSASASVSVSEEEEVQEEEKQLYLGVRIPPGLRDRVIEHCMALGERNLDAETVQAVIQCHEDLPAADIDWARKELRRSVPRRAAWPSNVREVIAQRDGSSARTPTKPADGYREPPPPHIEDVLEAIKNRPYREPSDPGEDALLADMKANNPAAYEAEMDLRRRAHERAMST
jgi:hypothetical protein